MSENNYRFYSFTNMYLSSIQKGIQTAHAVSEMYDTYRAGDKISPTFARAKEALDEWANSDKTIIVLDGGNSRTLSELYNNLRCVVDTYKFGYPVVAFYEDEQSLNGALTAVGIILPESVYSRNSEIEVNPNTGELTHALEHALPAGTFDINKLICRFRLAN